MNTLTPTPITEQHKALWTTLYNLAHDEIFEVASSDGPAHKLIADSEAEAVLKQTAYLKAMVQDGTNAMKERDELRAEVKRLKTCGIVEIAASNPSVLDYCKHWEARAELAEAELATERARLDAGQILLTVEGERVWHCGADLRAAIDAAMQEGTK